MSDAAPSPLDGLRLGEPWTPLSWPLVGRIRDAVLAEPRIRAAYVVGAERDDGEQPGQDLLAVVLDDDADAGAGLLAAVDGRVADVVLPGRLTAVALRSASEPALASIAAPIGAGGAVERLASSIAGRPPAAAARAWQRLAEHLRDAVLLVPAVERPGGGPPAPPRIPTDAGDAVVAFASPSAHLRAVLVGAVPDAAVLRVPGSHLPSELGLVLDPGTLHGLTVPPVWATATHDAMVRRSTRAHEGG